MKKHFWLNFLWHCALMYIIGCTIVYVIFEITNLNPGYAYAIGAGFGLLLIPILLVTIFSLFFRLLFKRWNKSFFIGLWIIWSLYTILTLPGALLIRQSIVKYGQPPPIVKQIEKKIFGTTDSHHPLLGIFDSEKLRKVRKAAYFPNGIFSNQDMYDRYFTGYLGLQLQSMKESSLNKRHSKEVLICRLVYIPTFSEPIVIKVDINTKNRTGLLTFKRTNGNMGYVGDRIIYEKKVSISAQELEFYLNQVNVLKVQDAMENRIPSVDGVIWSLEIVKNRKFSAQTEKVSTNTDIYPIAKKMFELAYSKFPMNIKEYEYFSQN